MNENLYSPPQSGLQKDEREVSVDPIFYVVSARKFSILFVSTFGMYQVYWAYKNWKCYQLRTQEDVWPIARGMFQIFFTHSLLSRVNDRLQAFGGQKDWSHSLTATLIVVFIIFSGVADRVAEKMFQQSLSYVFVSAASLLPLLFVYLSAQKRLNTVCGDPTGSSNDALTLLNYFWMLVGVLYWALIGVAGAMG